MKYTLIFMAFILVAIMAIGIMPTQVKAGGNDNVCPVCGALIGYGDGASITWETWTISGHGGVTSGCVLRCKTCGYTTERDANGNIPDPKAAQAALKAKKFPWYPNGWTHQQYVEWFYK